MKNKDVHKLLKDKYTDYCMGTGKKKKTTVHHMEKVADGGLTRESNCVLLNDRLHQLIHCYYECKEPEVFELINECFDLYKRCIDEKRYELVSMYETEIMPEYIKILERRR